MRPLLLLLAGCALLGEVGRSAPAYGEPRLTLDQALDLCVASPRVRAGRAAVAQARAEARTAALLPNPTLSVEAGLLPLSRRFTVEEPGGPTELAGGISFPLDWLLFGKRAAAVASADAAVRAAEADYDDLVRRRRTETAVAFYGVLEAEALLEVAAQGVGDLEQVEAATRRAAASGGRPRVELHRVRLELLSAQRDQRAARSAVVAARSSLRALLGARAPAKVIAVAGSLDGPLAGAPLPAATACGIAAEHRPDILALRRKAARAQRDVVAERRNALPETKLGLGVTHQFQRAIGAADVTAWGIGLEVALPLFDRNQGHRARAAAAAAQSHHELEAGLLELCAEVEQAVHALVTARANAGAVAQDAITLAAQVRDSFRQAYEAGGRSLLELLDAQRQHRETYRTHVASRADYWRALVRYRAALGRSVAP